MGIPEMRTSTTPLRFITLLSILLLSALVHAVSLPGLTFNENNRRGTHDTNKNPLTRRSITLDLQRNPDYTPNGPAAYARALRKWGAEVPGELVDSLAVMRGDVGEVGAESIRDDREYLSQVGFGTPLQWLNVDLDTGSADVWIYTSETDPSITQNRRVFKIEESSTAERIENATWTISYGDGSTAHGTLLHDTLSLASITLPNATLESAVSASSSLTSDPHIDGIFGLAFALNSQTTPQQPTVLSALLPLLAQPLFTVDLRWHSSEGAFTFGEVDYTRVKGGDKGEVWYTSLKDGAGYWEFGYDGVRVKGNNQREWMRRDGGFSALADTGTTLLLLAGDVAEGYYGTVPGAGRNWTVGGVWTYPCGVDVGSEGNGTGKAGLPDFEVGFGNGFVATVPGRFMNYTAMPDDAGMCMGGLQEWGNDDLGIFGDIFLKAVYTVFDVGGKRIGFAEKELDLG